MTNYDAWLASPPWDNQPEPPQIKCGCECHQPDAPEDWFEIGRHGVRECVDKGCRTEGPAATEPLECVDGVYMPEYVDMSDEEPPGFNDWYAEQPKRGR
jgi:hypothetical protein